jgi:hypothetical protein
MIPSSVCLSTIVFRIADAGIVIWQLCSEEQVSIVTILLFDTIVLGFNILG